MPSSAQAPARKGTDGGGADLARSALDSAMRVHGSMVDKYIARARQRRPDATPAEAVRALERMYRSTLTGTGAAVGAVAAVPAVGTGTALALSGGEVLSTLELTALFAFSLAQIHGVPLDEIERRRTLVMGIMIGGSGTDTIQKIAERSGQHWAKEIVAQVPRSTLLRINKVLGANFVTKYGTRQGIIVLGRVVPFGIGAVIGGAANLVLAETAIRASRRAFGPPPEFWESGELPIYHGMDVPDG
jgi:hypothetical protein